MFTWIFINAVSTQREATWSNTKLLASFGHLSGQREGGNKESLGYILMHPWCRFDHIELEPEIVWTVIFEASRKMLGSNFRRAHSATVPLKAPFAMTQLTFQWVLDTCSLEQFLAGFGMLILETCDDRDVGLIIAFSGFQRLVMIVPPMRNVLLCCACCVAESWELKCCKRHPLHLHCRPDMTTIRPRPRHPTWSFLGILWCILSLHLRLITVGNARWKSWPGGDTGAGVPASFLCLGQQPMHLQEKWLMKLVDPVDPCPWCSREAMRS